MTQSIRLDFGTVLTREAVAAVAAVAVGAAEVGVAAVVLAVVVVGAVVERLFLLLPSSDGVDVGLVGVKGGCEGARRRRGVGGSVGVEGSVGDPPSNVVDAG